MIHPLVGGAIVHLLTFDPYQSPIICNKRFCCSPQVYSVYTYIRTYVASSMQNGHYCDSVMIMESISYRKSRDVQ